MGQKTNPIILRLGKTKEWNFKYFEKKSSETALYSFYTIELEKFIYKFFKDKGLIVYGCKIFYFENQIKIFISYRATHKSAFLVSQLNKDQKLKTKAVSKKKRYRIRKAHRNQESFIRKRMRKYFRYRRRYLRNIKIRNTFFNKGLRRKARRRFLKEENILKPRRLFIVNNYKKLLYLKKYKNLNGIFSSSFFEPLLNTLNLFTQNKFNILLVIKQLNKNTNKETDSRKRRLIKEAITRLRKFNRNDFFKNGINTIYNFVTKEPSPKILSELISSELRKLKKRHNYFFRFVIKTIGLFCRNSVVSKLEAIKIKISGRINGSRRSRSRVINIGSGIPASTMNSKIDYSESTIFTSKGTLGVKVWTLKK